jgi:hypothetical protein
MLASLAGPLSARGVSLNYVNVSAQAVARVPGENLQVSRAEFGALWTVAEPLASQPGPDDRFLVGIVFTCRWLAAQPIGSSLIGRAEMPLAPFTERRHSAMPETVEAEFVAAAAAAARKSSRADLARGAVATLTWAWRGTGTPPLDLPHAAAI